ncbi:phosphoglycerate kinase [Candidatus Wolfebacteria bacterium]|nr:phosphoglycerate kinase [Candidatus Wolfebacteria bacterium]
MKFLNSLEKKSLAGEICLLRMDLDIENTDLRGLNADSHRQLPFRLEAALPTIKFLLERKTKVVILSHRGRPRSGIYADRRRKEFSLKPFVKILASLLKRPIYFIDFKNLTRLSLVRLKNVVRDSAPGAIFLLENLRFLKGEMENDKKFAKQLASLGSFYVNDAFGVSHRANASVEAITHFLPSYAGLHMEKELEKLNGLTKKAKRPFVIILGGSKTHDKLPLIKNLWNKADYFLLGGGVANTFFAAQGLLIGDSLRGDSAELRGILRGITRKELSRKVILPVDVAIKDRKILDIGPKTVKRFGEIIKKAKTIIWNGPMGLIEDPRFAKGSAEVARFISQSRAFSVVGGGETTSLITNYQLPITKRNIFLSTGGGAMLEYLAGKKLPGIEVLKKSTVD